MASCLDLVTGMGPDTNFVQLNGRHYQLDLKYDDELIAAFYPKLNPKAGLAFTPSLSIN